MTVTDSHLLYPWLPIDDRPALRWPGDRPVALAVVVLLEHVDQHPGASGIRLPGAAAIRVDPNLLFRSHREYGNRVGIFRLLAALNDYEVPASVAVDAEFAKRYPFVVEACAQQQADFIAHGISADRPITSSMSRTDERDYIASAREVISDLTGQDITGWYGPEQSGSTHTPLLLDELGFTYVCDWPNDEQPYLMNTPNKLISIPTALPLDDAVCVLPRPTDPGNYFRAVASTVDVLARDGQESSRLLVLVVRPWLTGRAYQIDAFERALRYIRESGTSWLATTGQIASEASRQLRRDDL